MKTIKIVVLWLLKLNLKIINDEVIRYKSKNEQPRKSLTQIIGNCLSQYPLKKTKITFHIVQVQYKFSKQIFIAIYTQTIKQHSKSKNKHHF